jgi:hypothetical protein
MLMKRLSDIELIGIVGGVSEQGVEAILENASEQGIEHALGRVDRKAGGGVRVARAAALAPVATKTTLAAAAP